MITYIIEYLYEYIYAKNSSSEFKYRDFAVMPKFMDLCAPYQHIIWSKQKSAKKCDFPVQYLKIQKPRVSICR